MENDWLSDICRVCANKIKDKKRQRHIFSYLKGKLLQNLKLITGVELLVNDNLPSFMCERCYSELDLAVKFRERCVFSQDYLQDMLNKKSDEFETDQRGLTEELIDEDQLEYIDQDLQFEKEQDYICEPYDVLEDVSAEEVVETVDFEDLQTDETPNKNKRHIVMLQDIRPVKRLRNFFICEECGEFYKNEDEYKEHLDCHIKRKESKHFFPCCLCSSFFHTKTLLKLHLRTEHNRNRLFKCNTCDETFLEHTAKQRHEIAHVNERPYPCLECDMIFDSVSELRIHSTSHSQRKYKCEPCSTDFTTRNQIIEHTNTQLHKHTVQQMEDEVYMTCDADEEVQKEEEKDEDELEEDDEIEYIQYS